MSDLQPLTVTLAEAMRALGIKKTKLNELCNAGRIVRKHIGRRSVVTVESLRKFVEELQ